MTKNCAASLRRDAGYERVLAELEEMLSDSIDGIERIASIAAELKQFTQLRPQKITDVDVSEVARAAHKLLYTAGGRRIDLDLAEVPTIRGDRGKLVQVIVNLLDNAIKAVPDQRAGEARVVLATRSNPTTVQIVVEDDGVGVPADLRSRIFEPCFTTRSPEEGTGLGLSLSSEYVQRHNGRIELTARPGGGSRFTVLLPRETGLTEATTPSEPPVVQVEGEARRGRVLLVDDEPSVLRAYQRSLRRQFEVVTATSAEAALDLLAGGARFSAVVCDISMPGMDGIAFFNAVAERFPALLPRIIFMTGGTFGDDLGRLMSARPNPVLAKPVDPRVLVRAIDGVREPERAR